MVRPSARGLPPAHLFFFSLSLAARIGENLAIVLEGMYVCRYRELFPKRPGRDPILSARFCNGDGRTTLDVWPISPGLQIAFDRVEEAKQIVGRPTR
ncbi:hypothetical protein F4808DRAFT_418783 [Astrocystis sublimbata]|nr:hypothetical protein F4808DRAFT_418783 [Astrocystis sublimbata]